MIISSLPILNHPILGFGQGIRRFFNSREFADWEQWKTKSFRQMVSVFEDIFVAH